MTGAVLLPAASSSALCSMVNTVKVVDCWSNISIHLSTVELNTKQFSGRSARLKILGYLNNPYSGLRLQGHRLGRFGLTLSLKIATQHIGLELRPKIEAHPLHTLCRWQLEMTGPDLQPDLQPSLLQDNEKQVQWLN